MKTTQKRNAEEIDNTQKSFKMPEIPLYSEDNWKEKGVYLKWFVDFAPKIMYNAQISGIDPFLYLGHFFFDFLSVILKTYESEELSSGAKLALQLLEVLSYDKEVFEESATKSVLIRELKRLEKEPQDRQTETRKAQINDSIKQIDKRLNFLKENGPHKKAEQAGEATDNTETEAEKIKRVSMIPKDQRTQEENELLRSWAANGL